MPWLSVSLDVPRPPCLDIVSSHNYTESYFNYLQLRRFYPCTSFFAHHCDNVPDKVNLKGTESCSNLRMWFIKAGKSWQQGLEGAAQIATTCRKQRVVMLFSRFPLWHWRT